MELQGSESDRRNAQVIFSISSLVERSVANPIGNGDPSTPLRSVLDDVELLKPAEPRIRKIVARAIRRPARWVDFAVWLHRYRTSLGLAAAIAQIANEFLSCVELCARRLVSIEIAYETNTERDVVQIIAVHVAAIDLPSPAIADRSGCLIGTDREVGRPTVSPRNRLRELTRRSSHSAPRARFHWAFGARVRSA